MLKQIDDLVWKENGVMFNFYHFVVFNKAFVLRVVSYSYIISCILSLFSFHSLNLWRQWFSCALTTQFSIWSNMRVNCLIQMIDWTQLLIDKLLCAQHLCNPNERIISTLQCDTNTLYYLDTTNNLYLYITTSRYYI